jgi:hypothetical protein
MKKRGWLKMNALALNLPKAQKTFWMPTSGNKTEKRTEYFCKEILNWLDVNNVDIFGKFTALELMSNEHLMERLKNRVYKVTGWEFSENETHIHIRTDNSTHMYFKESVEPECVVINQGE